MFFIVLCATENGLPFCFKYNRSMEYLIFDSICSLYLVLTTILSIDIIAATLQMKKKNESKTIQCLPKS